MQFNFFLTISLYLLSKIIFFWKCILSEASSCKVFQLLYHLHFSLRCLNKYILILEVNYRPEILSLYINLYCLYLFILSWIEFLSKPVVFWIRFIFHKWNLYKMLKFFHLVSYHIHPPRFIDLSIFLAQILWIPLFQWIVFYFLWYIRVLHEVILH